MKWIRVKDKYPPEGVTSLLFTETNEFALGRIVNEEWHMWNCHEDFNIGDVCKVIYWMPLPPPPID